MTNKSTQQKILASILSKVKKDTRMGLSDDDIANVFLWASHGMKPAEIMAKLGRSTRSAGIMMQKNEDFRMAFEKGQAEGVHTVSNKLFEMAKGGHVVAAIFWLKAVAGWSEEPVQQTNVNVNNTVQIYAPEIMSAEKWGQWVGQAAQVRELEMNKKIAEVDTVDVSEFSTMELAELSKEIEDAEET
jgi:hypothetical protein